MIESADQAAFTPLKYNLTSKVALSFLLLFTLCAVGADLLPLDFSPNETDLEHVYQPPFQWQFYKPGEPFHWLGTDQIGRDLLANIIYGARTALWVSIPAMIVAVFLGIILGCIAGYYGDRGFPRSAGAMLAGAGALLFFIFYFFMVNVQFITGGSLLGELVFKVVVLILTFVLYKLLALLLQRVSFLQKKYFLPVDVLILKLIELLQSVPRLLLVLCLVSFAETASVSIVIGLSAFTYWPGIARLVRAEMLKLNGLPFVEAAKALGFSDLRIILNHALPNALTPVIVAFAFGIGNLMALESTLSFLGVGIPADVPSWGRAIVGIHTNLAAWWLVLFPGLLLCLTILALQAASQQLIKLINVK